MKMGFLSDFLKGKENNLSRECFLWNIIAGGINAAEAVILMMVITRTNGVEAAGILSIAFAVGNLLMTIGKFSVRNFQVTDMSNIYPFSTYFTLRILTTLLMVFCSIIYVFVKISLSDYTLNKSFIVFGICLIYVIESFEEVFLGYYQRQGRLDIASKIFIVRWLTIMIVFSLVAICWHNLLLAVYLSMGLSFLCEVYLIITANELFPNLIIKVNTTKLWSLIKQCFTLFLAGFLMYYITNAPKYAIDQYLSEDIQAYYGYISMPVFVVELLNCFLYQPQMVSLADDWNNGLIKLYNKRVIQQTGVIVLLTIICVVASYILGIPVLSVLYGVDLIDYKLELTILMIAGGALAFVGYTIVLLTIMRKQNLLLYNMLIVTVLSIFGFGKIVQLCGVLGVVKYYLLLMFILALLNYCCIILEVFKTRRINLGK